MMVSCAQQQKSRLETVDCVWVIGRRRGDHRAAFLDGARIQRVGHWGMTRLGSRGLGQGLSITFQS